MDYNLLAKTPITQELLDRVVSELRAKGYDVRGDLYDGREGKIARVRFPRCPCPFDLAGLAAQGITLTDVRNDPDYHPPPPEGAQPNPDEAYARIAYMVFSEYVSVARQVQLNTWENLRADEREGFRRGTRAAIDAFVAATFV